MLQRPHFSKLLSPRAARDDDVLKGLLPMLEVDENLRKFQGTHKGARYKKFRTIFGEYIVDHYLRNKPKEEKK
jgi:hypothetical protein